MKIMIEIMIILCAAIGLCWIGLGAEKVEVPTAKVVMRPVKEQYRPVPALNIQFAIVDQPLQEFHEELNVVDSIVYIPEEIAIETEDQQEQEVVETTVELTIENEEVEEEFVEEYIEYEEPILMAIETKEIEDDEEVFCVEDVGVFIPGDGSDSELQEEVVSYETEAEIEIGVDEETIEEEEWELEEEIVLIEDEVEVFEEVDQQEQEEEADVTPTNGSRGQQIVDYARSWVGVTPYVSWQDRIEDGNISNSLETGTDCSGFVSLVYDTFGYQTSAASDDYQSMSNISYEELEPGDVVVYGNGGHVAIYAGDDTVIHCSNPEDGTIESDINYREPTGYVRIIDEEEEYYDQYGSQEW